MSSQIDHLLDEKRAFPPAPEFAANAVATPALYTDAETDREAVWRPQA